MIETSTFSDVPSLLYPPLVYLGVDVAKYSPDDNLTDITKQIDRENPSMGFYKKLAITNLLFAASSANTIEYDLTYACHCLELDLNEEIKISWNPFLTTHRVKQRRELIDRASAAIEYISNLVERPTNVEFEFKAYDFQHRVENSSHSDLKQFCIEMYDAMLSQEHLYKQIIKNGWGI
jgi:hypothetical protein